MRRLSLLSIALLLGVLAMFPPPVGASGPVLADSLFQAAIADTTRPAKERIALLRKVLKADWGYAPAHHALGRLYMAQNTVSSRSLARRRLGMAMRLDPGNVTYHESYATLLRRQGFYYNSMRHFKKILEMDPKNVQAACEVGDYLLQDMFKYIDSPRFDGGGSMRSFGLESRDEAASYFRYALEQDLYCRRAYYRLGFLYLENGYPEGLISLSRQLLKRYPGDPHGLLFLGLGYQEKGDMEEAARAYREALDHMGEEERRVMESIDLVAGREDRLALGMPADRDPEEGGTLASGLLLDRFWRGRDPLLLTPFNERWMAHYGRVAYADLRFSRPDEGVFGWETDMGKVYIRYGRYLGRERTIGPYREVWYYEDFQVSFYSYDSFHWWLELFREDRWVDGGYGRGEVFSPKFHLQERYIDPYRTQKYPLPCQIGIFKAPGNRLRVDLSWALPKVHLDYLKLYDTYRVSLEEGIFLFDPVGDPALRQVQRREALKEAWKDTLRSKYLLDRASVTVDGGVIPLSIEVTDRQKGTIGTFRDTLRLEPFGDLRLALSSILLATDVVEDGEGAEGRRLQVTPNPIRTYSRSELLYLYFEVYNLSKDPYGRTHYRMEYRMGTPKLRRLPVKLDRATQKRLGLEGERWTISVTSEYQGTRSDEPLYLGIDLSELKPGLQLLTLVVTDQITGLQAGGEALVRIVE